MRTPLPLLLLLSLPYLTSSDPFFKSPSQYGRSGDDHSRKFSRTSVEAPPDALPDVTETMDSGVRVRRSIIRTSFDLLFSCIEHSSHTLPSGDGSAPRTTSTTRTGSRCSTAGPSSPRQPVSTFGTSSPFIMAMASPRRTTRSSR